MERRRQWLLGGLGVVSLLVAGDWAYRTYVEEPSQARQARIERLRKDRTETRKSALVSAKKLKGLPQLEQASLPRNVELARSEYTNWLLTLVKECGFDSPRVDASDPAPIRIRRRGSRRATDLGARLSFSLRGSASLSQVVAFLHRFYSVQRLHKLRSVSLLPRGVNGRLSVSMEIEALSLKTATQDSELIAAPTDRLRGESQSAYRKIVERDLLRVGGGAAALGEIRLAGITVNATGEREAWFNTPDGRTHTLVAGDRLPAGGVECQILAFEGEWVRLELNGEPGLLAVGSTLADLQ